MHSSRDGTTDLPVAHTPLLAKGITDLPQAYSPVLFSYSDGSLEAALPDELTVLCFGLSCLMRLLLPQRTVEML